MRRGRQAFVVRQPGLEIRFAGLGHVSLAMQGARLVKRGDGGLGGVLAVELLAGRSRTCRVPYRNRPCRRTAIRRAPLPPDCRLDWLPATETQITSAAETCTGA